MKKIFTLFASFGLFYAVQAQSSFQILDQDNGNADVTGTTLDFWTDPGTYVIKELTVKNTSGATKSTRCKRVFVSGVMADDTLELCWNVCLGPITATTQTAGNISIASGNSVNYTNNGGVGFHSTLRPGLTYGVKTVRYVWYDNLNNSDSSYVTVNYHLTATGVSEAANKPFLLSASFPNPASSFTTLKYEFPVAAKTSVKLYNAMGAVVREYKIEDLSGKLNINTEDLSAGIYFYSLIVNDKATGTKKLIVSH